MKKLNSHYENTKSFFRSPNGVIASFLIICLIVFFSFVQIPNSNIFLGRPLTECYQALLQSVAAGGYSKYNKDKLELKKHISSVLAHPANEEEENNASNIALYLFPELLPDSNFEKSQALELWASLETEIEKHPRTPEARMVFEEMKSNIWNYENPKLNNVGLSTHAQETLKIYHELSSP